MMPLEEFSVVCSETVTEILIMVSFLRDFHIEISLMFQLKGFDFFFTF